MAKILFRNVRAGKRRLGLLDLESITRKEIERVMDKEVKPAVIKSHEIIVKDWNHKPEFGSRKKITGTEISLFSFPTGPNKKIWIFVDQGTKAHTIRPKHKKALSFEWGGPGSYQPKTLASPARTVSGGGTIEKGVEVAFKKVQHPGSEAREFTKQIAEDILPDYRRVFENAFRRIAREVNRS